MKSTIYLQAWRCVYWLTLCLHVAMLLSKDVADWLEGCARQPGTMTVWSALLQQLEAHFWEEIETDVEN